MHEGHFTEQIVAAILAELKKHLGTGSISDPVPRVTRVHVKVGETYHLVGESVLTHFAALARGTPLEGARLGLEEVPLTLKCRACGWAGTAEDHHFLICGKCENRAVDITGGNTVVIDAIDLQQ